MTPVSYRDRWVSLRGHVRDPQELNRLASQIALSFMDHYYQNGHFEEEFIQLLCEMATSFEDPQWSKAASSALFEVIVEGLCDDFEEFQPETYNRVMSEVIHFCRRLPEGRELHQALLDFGIVTREDLLTRLRRIRSNQGFPALLHPPEKILVLSRVTIGADVAITSVILQRLEKIFPGAEFVLLGSPRLREIFGGHRNLRVREVHYVRRGGLFERFSAWHEALESVRQETEGVSPPHCLLVDPDSRFSQLGVLPLTRDHEYLFFDSRGSASYLSRMTMAELANHWLNGVFGVSDFCYPKVWLRRDAFDAADSFCAAVRNKGCTQLIAVNFGVGGNLRKRAGAEFESRLLQRLLEKPNTVILLDRGFGDTEDAQVQELLRVLQSQGHSCTEVRFGNPPENLFTHGAVAVQCSIGEMGALISQCDEFIGYDSACQHISASLGIPTYTVFAGSNNTRFIRRWSACGPARRRIIHVDTLSSPHYLDVDGVISRIMDARAE